MTKEELEELDLMSEIQFQEWLNIADNFYKFEKYRIEKDKLLRDKMYKYCEKYIGSHFYDDILFAVNWGYNLAMEDE